MPQFSVLGVRIHNVTRRQAIAMIEEIIDRRNDRATSVFFVNAHTLNLAAADPSYRAMLNAGDLVFADGTGVRWAARLQGVRVLENLPGTDLIPALFQATADRGHSYFLLGADAATIELAADFARRTFPGWRLSGYHHGYLADDVLDGGRRRQDQRRQARRVVGGHGKSASGAVDPSAPAGASRAGVHGRRRSVRLIGRAT